MELLVASLSPPDLARFSCTCRYARTLCWDVAPGLNLTLYPHQVRKLLCLFACVCAPAYARVRVCMNTSVFICACNHDRV